MARLKLTVVVGTDTDITLTLSIDAVAINHSLITRAKLRNIETGLDLADSQTHAAAWSFANAANLTAKWGLASDLVAGRYRARLITYDIDHPNGLAWDTDLEITAL